MGYIYCITNTVTNKMYIGKSVRLPEQRIKEHFTDWELLNTDTKLTRAILKYGKDYWKWEVLEECNDEILSDREVYWINKYDSYKDGYNSTLGGDGCPRYIFDKQDIFRRYNNEESVSSIAKDYGCHPHYIHEILLELGIDTSLRKSTPKAIACFDREKHLIDIFKNKTEIQEYLTQYGYGNTLANVAHFVSQACKTGKMTYRRYWVEVTDDNIDKIKTLKKIGYSESVYGSTFSEIDSIFARDVRNQRLKEKSICKICGKEGGYRSKDGLCKSCSQIKAKAPNKPMKPSKEELIQLLSKHTQKEIAQMYQRSTGTVGYWLTSYGIK